MEDVHEFMGWLHSQVRAAEDDEATKRAREKALREQAVYEDVSQEALQTARRRLGEATEKRTTLVLVLNKASRCLV